LRLERPGVHPAKRRHVVVVAAAADEHVPVADVDVVRGIEALQGPDGPDGAASDVPVATAALEEAVRAAALSVQLETAPLRDGTTFRLRWGSQIDCRSISGDAERDGRGPGREVHPERVASYLAKYLTKATEDFGLPTNVLSAGHARSVGASPHAVRIIQTALSLAGQGESYARLRGCLATLPATS